MLIYVLRKQTDGLGNLEAGCRMNVVGNIARMLTCNKIDLRSRLIVCFGHDKAQMAIYATALRRVDLARIGVQFAL
jgi:hypothetical protein